MAAFMPVRRMSAWVGALAVACGLLYAAYERAPRLPLRPFCIKEFTYRLNVAIEVAGKQYSSEVVSQRSHSLGWLGIIHGGCEPTHGTTLSYRLADNRVVLMGSDICQKARKEFADKRYNYPDDYTVATQEHRKLDLTSLCVGVLRDQAFPATGRSRDGFIVDNADSPSGWRGFDLGADLANLAEDIRIVSAVAEATDNSPRDQLDQAVPAILKTTFEDGGDWSTSPEVILPFWRRYGPDRHFTYTAKSLMTPSKSRSDYRKAKPEENDPGKPSTGTPGFSAPSSR